MRRRAQPAAWPARLVWLLVRPSFLFMLSSCTATNPEFDSPCAAGARVCVESPRRASYPVVCGQNEAGKLALLDERCPGGICQSGLCASPPGAKSCGSQGDCSKGEVCAPLVTSSDFTTLAYFCLPAAQAPLTPGQRCDADEDCQSYLCLPYRNGNFCLRACRTGQDCTIPDDCRSLNITITGVSGTIQSCSPIQR